MSQANVELVRGLQPPPDVDIAQLIRDDALWRGVSGAMAPRYRSDFACAIPVFGTTKEFLGLDGLRAAWLDWLTPWVTYRTEVEDVIDFGDRVLVLVRDYGRHEYGGAEVEQADASIWTVCEGKIARAEFYPDRADALKAVAPHNPN
ncbi:MAG TPA: nuclear transport factor 2 family protein [Solirubrobacteraceae bacterium]|jgi:ketosteroid isomerase-like protein